MIELTSQRELMLTKQMNQKSVVCHYWYFLNNFMIVQKHSLVRNLILPRIFSVGQNVRCIFRLVGQI